MIAGSLNGIFGTLIFFESRHNDSQRLSRESHLKPLFCVPPKPCGDGVSCVSGYITETTKDGRVQFTYDDGTEMMQPANKVAEHSYYPLLDHVLRNNLQEETPWRKLFARQPARGSQHSFFPLTRSRGSFPCHGSPREGTGAFQEATIWVVGTGRLHQLQRTYANGDKGPVPLLLGLN